MYFGTKSYLKSNHYHNAKQALSQLDYIESTTLLVNFKYMLGKKSDQELSKLTC